MQNSRRRPGQSLPTSAGESSVTGSMLADVIVITCCEVLIVAAAALALMATPSTNGFPFPWSLPAVAAAAGYIALGSITPRRWAGGLPSPLLNSCLGSSPIVYVGKLSYPLYLWHWPVFVCCKWTIGLTTATSRISALVTTVMLAAVTYHGVEARVRRWRPTCQWHIFSLLLLTVGALEAWLAALWGPLYGTLYPAGDGVTAHLAQVWHAPPPWPPTPPNTPPHSQRHRPGCRHRRHRQHHLLELRYRHYQPYRQCRPRHPRHRRPRQVRAVAPTLPATGTFYMPPRM